MDDCTFPAGARRYHCPATGPPVFPDMAGPARYRGSFGAARRWRRTSGTANSTSFSRARRAASCRDVMPAPNTTCVRSAMSAPARRNIPMRSPSASRALSRCPPAAPSFSRRSSGDSALYLTITRAIAVDAAGLWVSAGATRARQKRHAQQGNGQCEWVGFQALRSGGVERGSSLSKSAPIDIRSARPEQDDRLRAPLCARRWPATAVARAAGPADGNSARFPRSPRRAVGAPRGGIVIDAIAPAVPAFFVVAARIRAEQHAARLERGAQFAQHPRQFAALGTWNSDALAKMPSNRPAGSSSRRKSCCQTSQPL